MTQRHTFERPWQYDALARMRHSGWSSWSNHLSTRAVAIPRLLDQCCLSAGLPRQPQKRFLHFSRLAFSHQLMVIHSPHIRTSIIVAMTPDRVIGHGGQLPWRLSADLRRFKRLTMGHHIIMGRKTYDSIGRLLPGRETVVVSRQSDLVIPGADVVHNVEDAVRCGHGDTEVFFIGGQQIYREALKVADRIYLTRVDAQISGDAFFPEFPLDLWKLVEEEHHGADEKNEFNYSFQLLQRAAT